MLLEVAFDAHVEGDVAGGAADAGAEEADVDGAVGPGLDELNIPAVGLDRRPHELDDLGDARGDIAGDLGGGWCRALGHRGMIAAGVSGLLSWRVGR